MCSRNPSLRIITQCKCWDAARVKVPHSGPARFNIWLPQCAYAHLIKDDIFLHVLRDVMLQHCRGTWLRLGIISTITEDLPRRYAVLYWDRWIRRLNADNGP